MKKIIYIFFAFFTFNIVAQVNTQEIREDFNIMVQNLSNYYIYFGDKNIDINCIKEKYGEKIDNIKTNDETVLFFEYLLDEFYDSHLMLNTSIKSSFRLYSPIYVELKKDKIFIKNIWKTQIENFEIPIIGAEVLKINDIDFQEAINNFPTQCSNKNNAKVREWITNKIISGRYNESRVLTLKLVDNSVINLDIDKIQVKKETQLLSSYQKENIGVIRLHNSLGDNSLIEKFDEELNNLFDTKGLIIDLRNTVGGGNTYVAKGIMGRFIDSDLAYQKHFTKEKYGSNPTVVRSYIEYVSPRGKHYKKPIIVLVGRWTGSMGEGFAIGLDGMKRAKIVGTEMERLAGSMEGISFKYQKYQYRIATEKLFHINGLEREKFVPWYYVNQTNLKKDVVLEKAFTLLQRQ